MNIYSKIAKRSIVLLFSAIFIVLSACSDNDEPKGERISNFDIEIEGITSSIHHESYGGYSHIADIPASGADFVITTKDPNAYLNSIHLPDLRDGYIMSYGDTEPGQIAWRKSPECDWCDFVRSNVDGNDVYNIRIAPNNGKEMRKITIEISDILVGSYKRADVRINQAASE